MRNSHPTFLLVLLEATYLVKDVIRCIAKIVTKMGNFLYNLIQLNNFKLEGTTLTTGICPKLCLVPNFP